MKLLLILLLLSFKTARSRPPPAEDNTEPANKKLKTESGKTQVQNNAIAEGNHNVKFHENSAENTGTQSGTVPSSSSSCYFSVERTSKLEQFPRDYLTKVSTSCEGELIRWSATIGTFEGDFYGAHDEMDLIAARGGGEYHDFEDTVKQAEIGNRFICAKHLKELLMNWKTAVHVRKETSHAQRSAYRCGMPSAVSKHVPQPPVVPGGGSVLTREEAKQLLEDEHIHAHIGTPLCKQHKSAVAISHCTKKFETASHLDDPITSRLRSALHSRESSETCSNSQPSSPGIGTFELSGASSEVSLDSHNSNGVCRARFYDWADMLGLKFISSRKPYDSLTRRSKRRKAIATRELISVALEMLAPGKSEDLRLLTFEHETDEWTTVRAQLFDNLMINIVSEYHKQTSRKERRSILALVTVTLPYSTTIKYFPGITRYEYTKSRMHGALLNRRPYSSTKREKFVKEHVVEFIDFVTSPLIRSDLPYGRRKLTKSDGTKMEVADTLRNLRSIEIIELFIKFKTDKGEEADLMSRATYYRILDACKATKRESLECVDYYVADALDSFDTLFEMLKTMKLSGYFDELSAKDFDKRLHATKLYLQTDFKIHLKFESKIGDHCLKYALSSPDEPLFKESCTTGSNSHDHKSNQCEKCQAMRDVFEDLGGTVTDLIESAQKKTLRKSEEDNVKAVTDLTLMLNNVKTAENNILQLKKHIVRSKHSTNIRQKIISELTSKDAFLTLDWAQKLIPQQSRESQSDYFGKAGISVHCTNALSVDASGNLLQHNFVHITKHESQDSITVLLILESLLTQLKQVGIRRVHLRSDNAGCYHAAKTITSLPQIAERSGVEILSYTFSETQSGKGAADRVASEMKTKIRAWLASGKNAGTPQEIFEALTQDRVPKAMSSYLCSIDRSTIQEGTTKIAAIQNIYDFRFEKDEMISRKFGSIGSGQKTKIKTFVASKGTMNVERTGGFLPSDASTFWKTSKCKNKCEDEDDDISENIIPFSTDNVDVDSSNPKPMETAVFTCPEDDCDSSFLNFANYEKHLAIGKHKLKPERETLLDVAIMRYADNIEGLKEGSVSTTLKEAFVDLPEGSIKHVEKEGWARPSKKTQKKYDKSAVQFVMDKFESAAKNKLRIYPKMIAQELRESTKPDGSTAFAPETWLNYKQILNLYQKFGKQAREMAAEDKLRREGKSADSLVTTTSPRPSAAPQGRNRGSHQRPKRESKPLLIDRVLEEVNGEEYDDSEENYDSNSDENSDFANLMSEIDKKKTDLFES